MAKQSGASRRNGKTGRKARGFQPAGGLIGGQMRTAQARRGFAQARLKALWPEIAGPELCEICWPERLASARGPAGGLLTLSVSGAHAPLVQMMLPTLRDRINAAMGPGTAGRIQLRHSSGPKPDYARPQAAPKREKPAPKTLPPAIAEQLSSIGDDDFRNALQTLAENVLSRQ